MNTTLPSSTSTVNENFTSFCNNSWQHENCTQVSIEGKEARNGLDENQMTDIEIHLIVCVVAAAL